MTNDAQTVTRATPPATSPAGGYSATTQQILRFLQAHPGEVFLPEELCEQLDCVPAQTRPALERLVEDGQISRQRTGSGTDAYLYPRR